MNEPRPMFWSIRREVWENRSVYIAPFVVAVVVVFGTFVNFAYKAHVLRGSLIGRLPVPGWPVGS